MKAPSTPKPVDHARDFQELYEAMRRRFGRYLPEPWAFTAIWS